MNPSDSDDANRRQVEAERSAPPTRRPRPDPKDLPGVAALTQTKADAKLQHRRDRGK